MEQFHLNIYTYIHMKNSVDAKLDAKLVRFSSHHKYNDAANTMSRLISLIASLNLFSSSVFPIFFAA